MKLFILLHLEIKGQFCFLMEHIYLGSMRQFHLKPNQCQVQNFGSEGPPEVHGNLAWLKPSIAFSLEIGPMKKLLEQG